MLRSARADRAALSMWCRAASEAEAEPDGGRDDAFVETPVERNVVGYLGAEGTCAKSNLRTGKRVVVQAVAIEIADIAAQPAGEVLVASAEVQASGGTAAEPVIGR